MLATPTDAVVPPLGACVSVGESTSPWDALNPTSHTNSKSKRLPRTTTRLSTPKTKPLSSPMPAPPPHTLTSSHAHTITSVTLPSSSASSQTNCTTTTSPSTGSNPCPRPKESPSHSSNSNPMSPPPSKPTNSAPSSPSWICQVDVDSKAFLASGVVAVPLSSGTTPQSLPDSLQVVHEGTTVTVVPVLTTDSRVLLCSLVPASRAGGVVSKTGGVASSDGGVVSSVGGVASCGGGVVSSGGSVVSKDAGAASSVVSSVGGVVSSGGGVVSTVVGNFGSKCTTVTQNSNRRKKPQLSSPGNKPCLVAASPVTVASPRTSAEPSRTVASVSVATEPMVQYPNADAIRQFRIPKRPSHSRLSAPRPPTARSPEEGSAPSAEVVGQSTCWRRYQAGLPSNPHSLTFTVTTEDGRSWTNTRLKGNYAILNKAHLCNG